MQLVDTSINGDMAGKRPCVNIIDRLAERQIGERNSGLFFHKTPDRLIFPLEDLVDARQELLECIVLGFTRNGDHLISYKRNNSNHSYSLQLWKFTPHQPVTLAIEVPLFGGLYPAAGTMGEEPMFLEDHMRIAMHEVVDSTFLIVHGMDSARSTLEWDIEPAHHITIIPYHPSTLTQVKVMHLRFISVGFSVFQPSGFLFTRHDDLQVFKVSQWRLDDEKSTAPMPGSIESGLEMEETICTARGIRNKSETGCVGVSIQRAGKVHNFEKMMEDEVRLAKGEMLLNHTLVVLDGPLLTESEGSVNICIGMSFGGKNSAANHMDARMRVIMVKINVWTGAVLAKKVLLHNRPDEFSNHALETLKCAAVLRKEIKRLAVPRQVHHQPHIIHNIGMLQTGDSERFIMHPFLPWGIRGPSA